MQQGLGQIPSSPLTGQDCPAPVTYTNRTAGPSPVIIGSTREGIGVSSHRRQIHTFSVGSGFMVLSRSQDSGSLEYGVERWGDRAGLEELNLSSNDRQGNKGLNKHNLILALEPVCRGSCPNLKRLNLSHLSEVRVPFCIYLARGIKKGHLSRLQELDLSYTSTELVSIAGVLEEGKCPDLRVLRAPSSRYVDEICARGLAAALASQSCRRLEVLDLEYNYVQGGALVPLLAAIRSGSCPRLRVLNLATDRDSDQGAVHPH